MPQKRDQRLEEQFEALLTKLEADGVIGSDWADSIRHAHGFGSGREIAEAAREGRAPPEQSGGTK